MSKPKLTGWYPGEVKPVRKGAYKKKVERKGKYQWWNGLFWGGWNTTPSGAFINRNTESMDQASYWRGLTEPSK